MLLLLAPCLVSSAALLRPSTTPARRRPLTLSGTSASPGEDECVISADGTALVRRKSARRTAVCDAETYRHLLASGLEYKQLDVRGNSEPLLPTEMGERRPAHPVAAALHARREAGSTPGARTDGLRIALAIEGGGMRGSVAAGMAAALHHLNLTDAIDAVYGSSAGSLVGAYLLTRQVGGKNCGCSIYYDILPTAGSSFIDLRNVLRSLGLGALRLTPSGLRDLMRERLGMPVLNLDFLLEEVVQKRRPLDWERFSAVQGTQPLRIVASDVTDQRARTLGALDGAFDSLAGLLTCMRASMLLPGICGPVVPLKVSGRTGEAGELPQFSSHADAMLFEPIPYRSAVAEGATHVLVLRTRPDGVNVVRRQSVFERLIGNRFFGRKMRMPHMAAHMREQRHRRRYAEDILILNAGAASSAPTALGNRCGPNAPDGYGCEPLAAHLLPVALQPGERGPAVDNLQTSPEAIFHAVRCGFARSYELLAPPTVAEPDGWEAATAFFPDELLAEIQEAQGQRKKGKAGRAGQPEDAGGAAKRTVETVDAEIRSTRSAIAGLEGDLRALEDERRSLALAEED